MKSIGKSLSLDTGSNSPDLEVPQRPSNFDLKIPGQTFLWQADERPSNCDKVCHVRFGGFGTHIHSFHITGVKVC